MLWRVADSNLHILGSVHVLLQPATLNASEKHALAIAETLAFEANFDIPGDSRIGQYTGARKLSDHVDRDLYEESMRLWSELGLHAQDLERTRPWQASFQMMNALLPLNGYHHQFGVDRTVIEMSKKDRKARFFLETRNAGLEPFSKAPLQEQQSMLEQVVRHKDEGLATVRSMVEAWTNREPVALIPTYEKCFRQAPCIYAALLNVRNQKWLPKLLRLAKGSSKAVATVGALHMVGPAGIPALLSASGLECVYVSHL